MFSVSESQGQSPAGAANKGPGSFEGAQKPFNRLGWNVEMSGQAKLKQDEVQIA